MPHVKAFAAKIPSESHILYLPGSYEHSYHEVSPVWWLSNKFSGLDGLNRSRRGIIESPKIFRNWPYVSSKVPVP